MAQTEKKAPPDWERIEQEYRAGLLSVREIAATQHVSHVAIAKRAKRLGWDRDLGARIKAKAEALVTSRTVTTEVTAEQLVTDRAIIEANAEVIAGIRLAHRKDIARTRALAMTMLEQLEAETGSLDGFGQINELLAKGELTTDKMQSLYHNVLALPGRTKTLKDLAETLHKLVGLEREAYSIGDQLPSQTAPAGATGALVLPIGKEDAVRAYLEIMQGKK